jgi:RNA polymerase sigma factor (sigma-70 family)
MAAPQLRALIRHIEKLSGGPCELPGTDRQLIECFAARHGEAAFAELVARHGPMVLRVCRRVLHHEQDAEDAFQATFIVLARSIGSIRKREAVGEWLHGVAYRTAMKAKRSAARRRNHEARSREIHTPRDNGTTLATAASPTWDDVQAVLDEEIQRLPVAFRSAFVLCVLEGKTVPAAAAELGCKEGTVSSRVTRARQRLQKELARRGIKLGVLLAALCVAERTGKAAVPLVLAEATVRFGLLVAAGGTAAGDIPFHIAALAIGVTRAMFLNKAKIVTVVLLAVGLFAAGGAMLAREVLTADEKPAAVRPDAKPPAYPVKPAEDTIEVTGRVLDPDGQPVAKARLYREHWLKDIPAGAADYDMVSLGTTDAEGRFRVKLPRPDVSSTRPCSIIAAADGFGVNWVDLKDGKPSEVTLRLVKEQVVRGRLINTEGQPVVGLTVQVLTLGEPLADYLAALERDGRMRGAASERKIFTPLNKVLRVTATDKDGRFEIAGLGAERLALVEARSDTALLPLSLIATRAGFEPKPKKPEAGRRGDVSEPLFGPSFEQAVTPCRLIEGTVRESGTGNPVVGAEVSARVERFTARAVTDAKGHYKLAGMPKLVGSSNPKVNGYRLTVAPSKGMSLLCRTVEAADRPGLETVTCDIELLPGVIVKGRVVDKATGQGVNSVVRIVPLPDNQAATKVNDANAFLQTAYTDAEGRFTTVAFPGTNVLLAQVGGSINKIEGVGVSPYKTAELDEADSKRLKLDTIKGFRGFATAAGSFEALDINNAVKVLDVKDAGPVNCDLTVDPGKTLNVNLEDPDGKPVIGVLASGVSVFPRVSLPLKTATCPVFALDPKQPRQLVFLHPERKLAGLITVRGDEKEAPTVRLTATATLTGRLLDPDGHPLAGVDILPLYPDLTISRLLRQVYQGPAWRTDQQGKFRLEGLIPNEKIDLMFLKGKEAPLEAPKTERPPLKSGETMDLGDIRAKPRDQ